MPNITKSKSRTIAIVILLAALFCTPLTFALITKSATISFSGQVVADRLINSLIGQFGNGTYYASNLNTGVVYATDTNYASKLINNAITIANSNNYGGTVQIDIGNFRLNETLIPKSNVYLKATSQSIIYQDAPTTLSNSISLMLTDNQINSFTLEGGVWEGNKNTLSDHRGSSTWNTNFGKYFGIGFYYGNSNNIKVMNVVIRNVIGFGISLGDTYNGYVYNCTVTNCGDNPITIEGNDKNYNSIVEYCTVVGGQDVGINTFHANNVTLRYNNVANITQYNGASHWGIAAENSANVNIIGNNITGCDYNIVSTSDDILIAQNWINGAGKTAGIQIQGTYRNIVSNNTIGNASYPLCTYLSTQTYDAKFINNIAYGGTNAISGTRTTFTGGMIYTTNGDGCISLRSARDVVIEGVTFLGTNGIKDYGQQSINVYVALNNFSALTGTKISLSSCTNVTYYNNIGYP